MLVLFQKFAFTTEFGQPNPILATPVQPICSRFQHADESINLSM